MHRNGNWAGKEAVCDQSIGLSEPGESRRIAPSNQKGKAPQVPTGRDAEPRFLQGASDQGRGREVTTPETFVPYAE